MAIFITPGGGTPGGASTEIQYNDSGAFAGSPDLTWDDTGKVLGVGGDIDLDDGGTYTTTLQTITPTVSNKVISLPDATGTVGLVGGSSGNLTFNNAGAYTGVANSSVDNATGNITLGSRFISSLNGAASAPPGAFTGTWFTGGTATTTKPQVVIEPTGTTSTAWSTSGTGIGVNAPAAFGGNLLDLQVNGTRVASVASNGAATFSSNINLSNSYQGFTFGNAASFSVLSNGQTLCLFDGGGSQVANFGTLGIGFAPSYGYSTVDLRLIRDAANTLAQRNGTNAQTFRVYNTFTDASNYERGFLRWSSNVFEVGPEAAGTGTARPMRITAATLKLPNLPTYADNTAALAGSLVAGDVYKTATGELRITV